MLMGFEEFQKRKKAMGSESQDKKERAYVQPSSNLDWEIQYHQHLYKKHCDGLSASDWITVKAATFTGENRYYPQIFYGERD